MLILFQNRGLAFLFLLFVVLPGCVAVGPLSPKKLKSDKNIVVRGESFTEDVDLTEILEFSPSVPGVMKAVVHGNLVFEKCNFYQFVTHAKKDGKEYVVEFKGDLVFDECLFRDTVNFDYLTVNGDFYAGKSEFMGPADFNYTWFKGRNTLFSNSVFYQDARFNKTIFENRAHFFKAGFKKAALFQAAVFKGRAFWGAATFDGYAEFAQSRFLQDLNMSKSRLNDRSNFGGMYVVMDAIFNNMHFEKMADFSKCVFFQSPEFSDTEFKEGQKGVNEE
ncbi:hypothetical protein [Marinilabilia rubra]|uniref:Pentapeptide repeat-containing protein n=1 Tax=Marinilabilia rubra TaxID=2162893 RepID=A0A2U2B3L2_9BACT|nr:hypothetical protein [Marinilabilia rubra]PWD97649.1 hypothetical protein DDZ16_19640 [Marinilabilia rubra]